MKYLIQTVIVGVALSSTALQGQVIFADHFNVTGSGTGFGANSGVNTDIASRTTGSAATGLTYIKSSGITRGDGTFSVANDKLQVGLGSASGRFTLSANGSSPFDFASALGVAGATAANPAIYDLTISMANNSSGIQRFSFALATVEDSANFWDFGVQLWRANAANDFYTIQKRIDAASYSEAPSAGASGDVNSAIMSMNPGSYGTQVDFRIRVTDAGAESGDNYNSRLQLFLNDTEIYDTSADAELGNHWRLDGAGRFFSWDQAPNSGPVTYDNFSVTIVPEPSTLALCLLAGAGGLVWRRW